MNLAKIALRTLTVCLLLLKSVSAAAAPPRVAVFWQPGFPSYNASPLLSPKSLMAALNAAGFDAVTLDANALSDSTHFNAHSFAALVLPYGNAYPVAAFANLCAFHRAGGSLILSGIPFTHPIAKNGDLEWTDQGHQDAPALFGPQGIGVGGFAAPDSPAGLFAGGLGLSA